MAATRRDACPQSDDHEHGRAQWHGGPVRRFFRTLGPGLVSAAANADPASVATFAQAGAVMGYALMWTPPVLHRHRLARRRRRYPGALAPVGYGAMTAPSGARRHLGPPPGPLGVSGPGRWHPIGS